MGLWRDVWVAATGPVALRYPMVTTKLHGTAADLTIRVEAVNASDQPLEGVLKASIENIGLSQPVRLAPHETRVVHFKPVEVTQPRLWWPAQVGEQNLYPLDLRFESGGAVSDSSRIQFGIREVTSQIDAQGHRVFRINGRNILVRGAGYTFDMLLRSTPERQDAELRYVRDMNLNAVRFEGKMEDDHFLDLCDRYGVLVLAGWCCCDHWEQWGQWDAEDEAIAAESLRDQLRRLARHPSLLRLDVWQRQSAAAQDRARLSRYPQGDRVAQSLPLLGHRQADAGRPHRREDDGPVRICRAFLLVSRSDPRRRARLQHGDQPRPFAAAGGIAAAHAACRPPLAHRFLVWNFHAGGGEFKDIHVFQQALDARYGKSSTVEEFARKAQVMAYEGHRAMFEAFGRNKYTSTGVIQWMLNNAWPGMIWHLYDWYLRPGGSYFGAKKANEPLHVQYSYDDRSVVVVNSYYRAFTGLKVEARVYNLDLSEKFSREAAFDAAEDSSTRLFTLPEMAGLSSTYFVRLRLSDAAGKMLSENFYWLSTAPETLDWPKSDWYHTPTKTFADYSALQSLPPVELKASSETAAHGEERVTTVTVSNPGRALAFAIRLKVKKGAEGDEILPVLWEDNYFALLPGETRRVTATWQARDLGRATPVVEIQGWNVAPATVQ